MSDPEAIIRTIVQEAMLSRDDHARRMAGYRREKSVIAEARRVPPDDDAFERAVGVFHRVYRHAYRPVLASEAQEAHDEATREALEAFLGCYIERATR